MFWNVGSILDKLLGLGKSKALSKDSKGQGGTHEDEFFLCLMVQLSSTVQHVSKLCSSPFEGIRGKVSERN